MKKRVFGFLELYSWLMVIVFGLMFVAGVLGLFGGY